MLSEGNAMDLTQFSSSFKTKIKIIDAIYTLTDKVPYDQINILAICETADISRSTFYHHFYSKNAALQWHCNFIYEAGIDRIGRDLTWFEGHLITTRSFEPYKRLYAQAGILGEYDAPRPCFSRHRVETLADTITQCQQKELSPLLIFQIEALAASEAILTNEWLAGNSICTTVKEFCDFMISIVPHELYKTLEKPIEQNSNSVMFANNIWY